MPFRIISFLKYHAILLSGKNLALPLGFPAFALTPHCPLQPESTSDIRQKEPDYIVNPILKNTFKKLQ